MWVKKSLAVEAKHDVCHTGVHFICVIDQACFQSRLLDIGQVLFCAFWTETKIKDLSYGQKETFFSFLAHSGSQSDHRSRSIFRVLLFKVFPVGQSLSGFRYSNSMSRGPQRDKKHLPKTNLMIQTYADYVLGKIGIEYH